MEYVSFQKRFRKRIDSVFLMCLILFVSFVSYLNPSFLKKNYHIFGKTAKQIRCMFPDRYVSDIFFQKTADRKPPEL
jgi:hypothetical protein